MLIMLKGVRKVFLFVLISFMSVALQFDYNCDFFFHLRLFVSLQNLAHIL